MTLTQCFGNMPTSILRVLCMFFRYGLAKTRIHAQPTSSVRFACGQRRLGSTCRSCGQCQDLRRCRWGLVIHVRSVVRGLTDPVECKYGLYITGHTWYCAIWQNRRKPVSEIYACSTFSHGLYGTRTGRKCSNDRGDPHHIRVLTVLALTETVCGVHF